MKQNIHLLYNVQERMHVTENGVFKLLQELKPHKATGPDCLSPRFLKEIATPLTQAQTLIYQATLDQGRLPTDWIAVNVAPFCKKGYKRNASNYRPVSLISMACKVLQPTPQPHNVAFWPPWNTR